MTFVRSPLFALAALAVASAAVPALAQEFEGGLAVTTNSLNASNIAAGTNNEAVQKIHSTQLGAPGYRPYDYDWHGMPYMPSVTTNSLNASNVAAGTGNEALQKLGVRQSGSGFGVVTNNLDAQNLAAGVDNIARQRIFAIQK